MTASLGIHKGRPQVVLLPHAHELGVHACLGRWDRPTPVLQGHRAQWARQGAPGPGGALRCVPHSRQVTASGSCDPTAAAARAWSIAVCSAAGCLAPLSLGPTLPAVRAGSLHYSKGTGRCLVRLIAGPPSRFFHAVSTSRWGQSGQPVMHAKGLGGRRNQPGPW